MEIDSPIQEFLLAIDVTSAGTPDEKLQWAFRMYDVDGNGIIDLQVSCATCNFCLFALVIFNEMKYIQLNNTILFVPLGLLYMS